MDEALAEHLAEGAADYHAARYWHAHEDWEEGWHLLRGAGRHAEADLVQGLILATAAFENLSRGKPAGFRVQLAKALVRLRAHAGVGGSLGLANEAEFREALTDLYLEACQDGGLAALDDLPRDPPRLELVPPTPDPGHDDP